MTAPVYIDRMSSPLGSLLLAHGGGQLCALDFHDYESRFRQILARRFGHLPLEQRALPPGIHDALQSYLAGDVDALEHIPVHASGTSFQQKVWNALRTIPAGATWTYAQLATAIGQPTASRAVGLANAHNPVAIVVPCHRVIGSSGGLTGYAGGLERKHWLLNHEGALCRPENPSTPQNIKNKINLDTTQRTLFDQLNTIL
jgi:methylated-DNA-[protein]-cysteine S-methyltransferase